MEKTKINYVKGDATEPIGDGKKIILHVCNNIGKWGKGFVLAISRKWKQPEEEYKAKFKYELGTYDIISVGGNIYVCNLIGQEGIDSKSKEYLVHKNIPPIRYVAIEKALSTMSKLYDGYSGNNISIHMPMIGSGLAGGDWRIIERIIEITLCEAGIPVTVYEFE